MRLRYLFALFIIFSGEARAQAPSIQWQKCLGGTGGEGGFSIETTPDGGYLVAGTTQSNDGDVSGLHVSTMNARDYWVVKLNSSGAMIWQKCYGGSDEDDAYSLALTKDNGFIIAGYTASHDGDVTGIHLPFANPDYWVIKCDSFGTIQWQKCLGGSADDLARKIINCYDGGYAVIGSSNSHDYDVTGNHNNIVCQTCYDAWLTKLDSAGNFQWKKCYGGTDVDDGYSILQTPDSGYVLALSARSNDGDVIGVHGVSFDYWIVKTDSLGSIQWQKSIGGTWDEVPYDLIPTFDHGYVVIGSANSINYDVTGNHGFDDAWIVKLDSIGNLQWEKCFGGSLFDLGTSITQLADSSYLALGYTNSNDSDVVGNHSGFSDVWLLKLTENGNLEWQKCLGGTSEEQAFDMLQTTDGGFVFTGTTGSNDGDVSGNHGAFDTWVVKLSPLPNAIVDPTNFITDFTSSLNTATNQLTLTFYAKGNEHTQIQLLDITGRVLLSQPLAVTAGFNKQEIPAGQLAAGVYVARLTTEGGSVVKKLIKN